MGGLVMSNLRRCFDRLIQDERGVSAVEFAFIAPLMLSLYLGAVEVSQAIGAGRKVTLTARTVADLISQVSTINNADMSNSLAASSTVMVPYAVANLTVVVSSVAIDANGKATIAWSDTLNGTARSVGSTVTLPTALNVASSSLIWSEVSYSYKPVIGYVITGTMTLTDQIYMRPRLTTSVTRTAT